MKLTSLKTVLIAIALFVSGFIYSQAPQRMSYQSIIRNTEGVILTNTAIGVKVSILKDSQTGTAVYEETFSGNTNENGLLTLEIGGGTAVSGTFSAINWSTGIYYVKTETDPAGGINYSITGVGQLLSVPYAFYSSSSSNQGKTTIVLTEDITDAEAAAQIARELGYNTENIIVDGTTQLTTVDFTGATNLLSVSINNNTALAQVNFSTLTKVFNSVHIIDNPALATISFPLLKKVSGNDLFVNGNTALTSISFPLLEKVDTTSLKFNDNIALTQIDIPLVKKLYELNIYRNTALTTVNAPQLYAVSVTFNITLNPNVTVLNIGALQTVGTLEILGTSLTTVTLPQLTTAASVFTLMDNLLLQSFSVPLLNNSGLYISGSPVLSTFNADGFITGRMTIGTTGLTTINMPNYAHLQDLVIADNPALNSVTLSGIQTTNDYIFIGRNPALSNVTIPDGIDFSNDANSHEFQITQNALTSANVNELLHKMLTAIPASYKNIFLDGQVPPAPPTGQGITDKQTLITNNNTVHTD